MRFKISPQITEVIIETIAKKLLRTPVTYPRHSIGTDSANKALNDTPVRFRNIHQKDNNDQERNLPAAEASAE